MRNYEGSPMSNLGGPMSNLGGSSEQSRGVLRAI